MKTLAPAVAAFLFIAVPSYAQFFTLGSEPASVKWSSIDTPTYRIIYPSGMDSLARTYALTLEQVASPVGTTAGFRPNESYRRRMPVILHPHTAYSNGQVTWTPRRMDLMTTPESRNPEPTPWERQLAIHESRHVAQMQFTAAKPFREWKAISGQLVSGALAAIYCGPSFFEGDAVVAETALSDAGRGRTADFLEYFRVSFAEGDYRDYWKWRFGSQRHYTPDYYRIGYVTAAGIRSLYDVPDFTARYFDRIRRKGGMAFDNFGKTLREVSGKDFDEAYGEICRHLAESWSENEASRAPFMEGSQIVGSPYRFTEYKSLAVAEDRLYAIRSGITRPEELVRILENGKTKKVAGFSASATNPQYSRPAGRLYWSEFIPDARWEMRSFSDIFSIDGRGRRKRVTRRKRYYNPAPSGSEKLLAVTHYPTSGGSSVCIIDALTGEMKEGFTAPDGVQAVESVWIGETVYASAISEDGFGIYRLPEFSAILAPAPSKIRQLREHEGRITFVCDRNGADELYSIDPNAENPEKSLLQLSSTRFGASDFQFGKSGDSLYFSALGKDGRLPFVIAADSLRPQPAEFAQLSAHAFAEELGASETLKPDYTAEVETSRPRRYSRLANLFRFHSWLPLYVDEDVVGNLSLSSIATSVSPGATVFFQNDLGDAYGSVAYSLTHDSQNGWRNAGHLNFSYAGWLPVIQARLSVNTRAARDHVLTGNNYAEYTQTTSLSGRPLLSAAIDSYVPLNFSSGGWSRGLVPKINLSLDNDSFIINGIVCPMARLTAGVRGYVMERIPSSRIYPRWGIGAEIGVNGRPFSTYYMNRNAYALVYAYVPGLWQTHGLKLTALGEVRTQDVPLCEAYVNTMPRGMDSYLSTSLSAAFPHRLKLSADYAMPVLPLDWSWMSPVAYVRNLELTPHIDITLCPAKYLEDMFSAGADLCVRLGNFLWVPYDTRIGVSYNYNGGSLFDAFKRSGVPMRRHSFDFIFSIDF